LPATSGGKHGEGKYVFINWGENLQGDSCGGGEKKRGDESSMLTGGEKKSKERENGN